LPVKQITAWMVLGHVHLQRGSLPEAEHACRQALSLAPQLVGARCQLVEVLGQQYRVMEAEQQARTLVADAPEFADGWKYLGMTLGLQAACEESFAALRKALEIQPNPTTHSKLLCGLQYSANVDPESLLRAHKEWAAAYELPHLGSAPTPVNWPTDRRKLRLGFVSADFREHPVGFLALPALEHLDKTACSVICYSEGGKHDAYTNRFRTAADEWRDTSGLPHRSFAEIVHNDQIDMLFDLSGHFGYRLEAFARKLAPLQITWLGYVGTTGLSAMNYLLADKYHIHPGEERWYTEAILRMPHGYACYGPPADAPAVAPLPALATGRMTFGCFNNPAKYTPGMFDAWAKILTRLPDSQLLLKCCWPNPSDLQTWFHGEFAQRGVDPKRILVEGSSSQLETMASYGRVDLALDTHPYSGGLTTCEALWMGVPVITYPGKTFAGRHSTSHLTNAGYPQFIADDEFGYVELAVRWTSDLLSLAAIRANMREQMRRSPLCDAARFAGDFLQIIELEHRLRIASNSLSL
jgi:protein O-GlcNAc transferase